MQRTIAHWTLLMTTAAVAGTALAQGAEPSFYYPFLPQSAKDKSDPDPRLGTGFDTILNELRGLQPCINVTTRADAKEPPQSVVFSLEHIETSEQLRNALNLSASASFGFGVASMDAAASFYQAGSRSRYSALLILKASVRYPQQIYQSSGATAFGKQVWASGKPAFLATCGNKFVTGIEKGAEFVAAISIQSQSEEEYQSMRASLQGGIAGTFSVKADADSSFQKLKNFQSTSVRLLRTGGIDMPKDFSIATITAFALEYPGKITFANAWPIRYLLADYVAATGWQALDLRDQERTLVNLADTYDKAHRFLDSLEFQLERPDLFPPFTESLTRQRIAKAKLFIESVTSRAALCTSNALNECKHISISTLGMEQVETPIRWTTINALSPAYQAGGATYDRPGFVLARGRWNNHLCRGDWLIDGQAMSWQATNKSTAQQTTGLFPATVPANSFIAARVDDVAYEDNTCSDVQVGLYSSVSAWTH